MIKIISERHSPRGSGGAGLKLGGKCKQSFCKVGTINNFFELTTMMLDVVWSEPKHFNDAFY